MQTHGIGVRASLPAYFYSLTHHARWYDKYVANELTGEDRLVLTLPEMEEKYRRNREYGAWLSRHQIRPKQPRWQAIRVIRDAHKETTPLDWWPKYYGAMFRVWQQPETFKEGREWVQYYVLCPEDAELVQRYELELKGIKVPERSMLTEKYLSRDIRLSKALVIPTSCAWQLRNETAGGKLEHAAVL